jgi:hypothetical protein
MEPSANQTAGDVTGCPGNAYGYYEIPNKKVLSAIGNRCPRTTAGVGLDEGFDSARQSPIGTGRVPHVPPDFLWSLLALANFMRLSLLKAAHAVVGWSHVQEIRVAKAYVGRE